MGDFLRGHVLLLDRRGDRLHEALDLPNSIVDLADRSHARARRSLDGGDLRADFGSCSRGLAGERLHFCGNDSESLAGLTRPRGLDGRIQGQQIGLLGNRVDHLDNSADPFSGNGEAGNFVIRPLGSLGRAHDDDR